MRFQTIAALLMLAPPAFAAPAPTKDSDCDITVKPTESIQKAINKAKRGDKIIVEAGVYYEQLTITKDGIHLIGKNAVLKPPQNGYTKNFCTGLTRNFPPDETDTDAGICIYGDGFDLAPYPYNRTLQHRKVSKVGDYVKDVVVTGFNVTGFSGENVAIIGGKNVKISKNYLIDAIQYGFLTVGSKGTVAERNVITSNFPFVPFIGMCMDDKSDAMFKDNDISNYYIALCGQTPGGEMRKNTVTNCCYGPFIDPGVKGMKVIENTISGRNPGCMPADGTGLIVLGAINTIVERNTIENIRNNGTGLGIYVGDDEATGTKATGNEFKKNRLRNNDLDIIPAASANDSVFKNNVCEGTLTPGFCNN
jgi:nitrous oxidase accessory protein NosD